MEIRYTNDEVAKIIEEYVQTSLPHFVTDGMEIKMESYYGQVTVKITPQAKAEQPKVEPF